jgi:hypothetical protein
MGSDQIDYRGVLADLKARRAALDQAIAAIEAIVGEPGTPLVPGATTNGAGSVQAREIEPDTFFSLNSVEATKKLLGMVGKAQPTKQIAEALNRGGLSVKTDSVAVLLQRAVKNGDPDLVSPSRGMWGLKRWYGK